MDLEFSRPLDVTQCIKNNKPVTLTAKPNECALLSKRLDILEIKSLIVSYRLKTTECPKTFILRGHLKAEIAQACVSTLKPVVEKIEDHFEVTLRDEKRPETDEFDMNEDIEDIDYIEDGLFDGGEIAAQYLSLNLDPYPRAPDAPIIDDSLNKPKNPFDVLAKLKDPK